MPKGERLKQIVLSNLSKENVPIGKIKGLLAEFEERRDKQNHNLATDQLLNAVYLALKEGKRSVSPACSEHFSAHSKR